MLTNTSCTPTTRRISDQGAAGEYVANEAREDYGKGPPGGVIHKPQRQAKHKRVLQDFTTGHM